jgi:DNA topoisomerase-1
MEEDLDEIAEGHKEYKNVLSHYYFPLHEEVLKKDSLPKATNLGIADAKFKCPECGSGMVIKLGSTGKFLSCDRYPDCSGALALDGTHLSEDTPLGIDPVSNLPVYILSGRFGPYVQLGKLNKEDKDAKPRRASLPPKTEPKDVTLEMALHLLVLPRELGIYEKTGQPVIANVGRFGPYVGVGMEFRSLKKGDDPYTVTFERAVELLETPKALPKGASASLELGELTNGKKLLAYQDKKGVFIKKGLRREYIEVLTLEEITPELTALILERESPKKKVAKKRVAKKAVTKKAVAKKVSKKSI